MGLIFLAFLKIGAKIRIQTLQYLRNATATQRLELHVCVVGLGEKLDVLCAACGINLFIYLCIFKKDYLDMFRFL